MLSPNNSLANQSTIENYNNNLPYWGVSWAPDSGHVNGYHPSFYTGFAVRSPEAKHVHVRTSRGNQTRVSVILTDQALKDYLYDLKTRYEFYKLVTSTEGGFKPMIRPIDSAAPQLEQFQSIIESDVYGILSFLAKNDISEQELYNKSLETLKALNPGRVFDLNIDLKQTFGSWARFLSENSLNVNDANDQIIMINALVWGRVNLTSQPSTEMINTLKQAVTLSQTTPAETAFFEKALELFRMAAGSKYDFQVLKNNQWQPALNCPSVASGPCALAYPEFTTIYPTGSVKSFTKDKYKNRIPQFATPGLWNFIDTGSRDDVDYIRNESYYGWAPKMDYEEIGNGFHNPAVRFRGISSQFKDLLGVPRDHNTIWAVKRGGVSSGCLRLPLGHVWEMRHLFPVENEKMKQIFFFGDMPQNFDVYDINGDGSPEVMGVEYMVSYDLQGAKALAKREGKDLYVNRSDKSEFYNRLYGSKNVFVEQDGKFLFQNPGVSFPSWMDYKKKSVSTRLELSGSYPLFEQSYERDKVQFYTPISKQGLTGGKHRSSLAKRIVRIMGRVRGCAPSSDKQFCGESQFQSEKNDLLKEISAINGRDYE